MGNTTIYVSQNVKEQLDGVKLRKTLRSYQDTIRYLVGLEKEVELSKLGTPTLVQIEEVMTRVVRSEIEKAKRY
jgi:hypothetical protein